MDVHRPQQRPELHSISYHNYSSYFNIKIEDVNPQQAVLVKRQHFNHQEPMKNQPVSSKPKKSYFKRILDGVDGYCDNTTIHGLKYVGDNNLSIPERLFWFIAVLCAIFAAIFFISNLFINYNQSPVTISFNPKMVPVNEIPFPAITICNVNVGMKSRVARVNSTGTKEDKFILEDICNIEYTHPQEGQTIQSVSWEAIQNVIYNITQLCSEMFLACKWERKLRNCEELINPVITDDGYCCTFNKLPLNHSLREDTQTRPLHFPSNIINWTPAKGYPADAEESVYPYRSYGRGMDQGLTLVLDANLDEYYCSTTSSIGFKVILATPLDSPKVAKLAFSLAPGIESRIPISAKIEDAHENIRGIDWKKRQCLYSNERYLQFYRRYSSRNCLLECEANHTLQMCKCVTFDMPRDSTTKICSKADDGCVDQARFHIERVGKDKSNCGCLPGCFEVIYEPDFISMGKLDEMYDIIEPEFIGNKSREYFGKNAAIIHFYYSVDTFQKQTKNALYGFPEFLSNTGGLLGLFLGFSFLSAVEIVYFIFLKGPCKWCNTKRNHRKTSLNFIR